MMEILLWHVHGAWTTAFVQGAHRYLIPTLPERGPWGGGRPAAWEWPATAVESAPEELADADVDVVVLQRPEELELADVADIVVLPGAARAMAELAGARTAIATSAARDLAKARIAAADLVPPTVIITVDDVRRGKPAPDPFLEAARRLDVDPADCLVVEDATNGLQAARSAGCATLGLLTTTPADQLDADLIVPDLAAVEFAHDGDRVAVAPR